MTRKSLLLAVCVMLLLIVTGIATYCVFRYDSPSKIARIYHDGELIKTIDLIAVSEEATLDILGTDGETNVVSIRHGEIAMQEANCPDKVCVHMGYISNGHLPIACLPNHVLITIDGGEDDGSIDTTSY